MARVNYRIVTLCAALGSAILMTFALGCLVTALVNFRAEDFLTASKVPDFTTLGTCIETLSESQVQELEFTNPDLKCEDDREKGNRRKVRNALSASVHGVMWAWYKRTNTKTLFTTTVGNAPADPNENKMYHFQQVVGAMITHVMGGTFQDANGVDIPNVPEGINYTTAQFVLREVAKMEVPVDCDELYGRTWADITDDDNLVSNDDGATTSADTGGGTPQNIPGRFWDTTLETYIKNIRKGRLNSDEEVKDTWPLADLIIDCDEEARSPGEGTPPNTGEAGDAIDPTLLTYLHAHCHAQFQFASVGTTAWDGTYGIPLPGIEPGPFYSPYPQADGFNGTSTFSQKSRMYLGQRFGWAVWAYVPMFIATCFLLADAVVFFLAEAIMPLTLADTKKYSTSALNQARDSLVIAATSRSSRKKRLAIGFFAVFVSYLFYGIFIAGPWGFFYTNLARPECEKSDDLVPVGGDPSHGVPQIGWKGTNGGWKSDYDATWYDLAALTAQLFVLCLLPLTTTEACRQWNSALSGTNDERAVKAAISDQAQIVSNTAKYRLHQRVFVLVMFVGILIIIVGQSISGARFGMAWAEGIVDQEWNADRTGYLFDEVVLSEHVYDQTVSTIALVVACGLVFATAMQRHLINGVGCYSAALFFAWILLVIIFALPLTFYAANRSIFNEKASTKDCVVFPRTSHEFENDLCISRFWTLLVGGGIFVATLLLITALGLAEALPALLKTRKRAAVYLKANPPPSQVFRASTPGMQMQAGYRSETEPFFNYKTKPIESSDDLLYAPRVEIKMPRR